MTKKSSRARSPNEELRQALEKFEESKEVAETSMHNFLETDIEQMSQLPALVEAQLDYHQQAVQILDELAKKLKRRMQEASLDSSGSISPSLGSPLTSESLSSPKGVSLAPQSSGLQLRPLSNLPTSPFGLLAGACRP